MDAVVVSGQLDGYLCGAGVLAHIMKAFLSYPVKAAGDFLRK